MSTKRERPVAPQSHRSEASDRRGDVTINRWSCQMPEAISLMFGAFSEAVAKGTQKSNPARNKRKFIQVRLENKRQGTVRGLERSEFRPQEGRERTRISDRLI